MREVTVMLARIIVAVAASAWASGCTGGTGGSGGGGTGGGCASFSGAYDVTTEIVDTTCPVGLHTISQPVTWTFTQAAPSCDFTMTNSLYSSSVYSGHFTMDGTRAKVTWTSVMPAPVVGGRALTYTAEDLTITAAAASAAGSVSGSFEWSSAYPCTGTTNVCSGTLTAGCPIPN